MVKIISHGKVKHSTPEPLFYIFSRMWECFRAHYKPAPLAPYWPLIENDTTVFMHNTPTLQLPPSAAGHYSTKCERLRQRGNSTVREKNRILRKHIDIHQPYR